MDSESISQSESHLFPDIIYNYFKIPADLQKAELHGLAYKVYEQPQQNSVQCNCCNFYKDHIKFKLCSDLNKSNDCFVASEYFQTIKWMLIQLTILCIVFVPFALFYNRQGDECEKHSNCDQNSLKIYSIWNQVPQYFNLTDLNYAAVILLTIFIFFIQFKNGYFKTQMVKIVISLKTFYLLLTGVYFPDRIKNEEILDFLNRNSEISSQFYLVNLKLYEDVLFEKLKFTYLREKVQQKKIILREVFDDNEDIKQTLKQSFLFFSDNDIIKLDQIKNDFIQLCKEQDQKFYHKFQIRSPYFQFSIQVLIAGLYSQPLVIAQFIILKLRYDLINTNFNGEDDQILKQFLDVCLTLLSMITFMIFDQIGTIILSRLALVIYHFYMIYYMFYLQSLDFETWNMFQNNFTQTSYKMLQNQGMIDYLITLSYLNLIIPAITEIFDYNYFWKKIKMYKLKMKKNNHKTQREANQLFQARQFNFYQKQIVVSKIFAISMMFGFQYPLIIPFSILSLLIIYWVDKYLLINNAIPVMKDKYEELLQGGYFLFNIFMLFIFFGQCFMFFKYWILIILYLIFIVLLFYLIIVSSQGRGQYINIKEILDEIIVKQYDISNDEKYRMFLNLQTRLKKFAKKQKKRNVIDESILLN